MSGGEQPFQVRVNERTHMVVEAATGRCLGAVGANYYSTWVFPLYTPAGLTVVRAKRPYEMNVMLPPNVPQLPALAVTEAKAK